MYIVFSAIFFVNEFIIATVHTDSKGFIKSNSETFQCVLRIKCSRFIRSGLLFICLLIYLFIYLFIYHLFQFYLMLVQLIPFAIKDQSTSNNKKQNGLFKYKFTHYKCYPDKSSMNNQSFQVLLILCGPAFFDQPQPGGTESSPLPKT